MEKVLNLLEKHVQWAVLGLASLFLLFVLWGYLPGISSVTSVSVGNQQAAPGEIDRIIEVKAQELDQQMQGLARPKAPVVPQFDKQWLSRLANPTGSTSPVDSLVFLDNAGERPDGSTTPGNNLDNSAVAVNELPLLPAAKVQSVTFGVAYVAMPSAAPAAAAPAPAAGVRPAPATPAAANNKDVSWIKITYTVAPQNIDKAFQEKLFPPELSQTAFVRAEVLRQEMKSDGSWGQEQLLPFVSAIDLPAFPEASSPRGRFNRYLQTILQQPVLHASIVQPPFFQVLSGEDPMINRDLADPTSPALVDQFDPTTFTGDINTLSPERRTAVLKERQRRAAEEQKRREDERKRGRGGQPGGPGGRGGRGGGSGGGSGGPSDLGAGGPTGLGPVFNPSAIVASADSAPEGSPTVTFQNRPPVRPGQPGGTPPRPDGYPEDMPWPPPGFGSGMPGFNPGGGDLGPIGEGEGMPGNPFVPQPQGFNYPLPPQAPFIPQAVIDEVTGWAFDISAQPEKTYRYRIRYSIVNPLFIARNAQGIKPELMQIFALSGEDNTVWSDPVTLQPQTHFFVVNSGQNPLEPQTQSARISIYVRQDGQVKSSVNKYRVGDPIGAKTEGADFTTDWTLIDVRPDPIDPRKAFALVMAKDGQVKRIHAVTTEEDPTLKDLDAQSRVDPSASIR